MARPDVANQQHQKSHVWEQVDSFIPHSTNVVTNRSAQSHGAQATSSESTAQSPSERSLPITFSSIGKTVRLVDIIIYRQYEIPRTSQHVAAEVKFRFFPESGTAMTQELTTNSFGSTRFVTVVQDSHSPTIQVEGALKKLEVLLVGCSLSLVRHESRVFVVVFC